MAPNSRQDDIESVFHAHTDLIELKRFRRRGKSQSTRSRGNHNRKQEDSSIFDIARRVGSNLICNCGDSNELGHPHESRSSRSKSGRTHERKHHRSSSRRSKSRRSHGSSRSRSGRRKVDEEKKHHTQAAKDYSAIESLTNTLGCAGLEYVDDDKDKDKGKVFKMHRGTIKRGELESFSSDDEMNY